MRRGEVREKLVDTALRLCARDGVGATTIRGVIRETGANLNSIHYHFGSWEGLVDEVAARALERLNGERFAALDAHPDGRGGTVEARVRAVLEAAYGPLFRQALGPEHARTRPDLSVVQQLRFDPSGLAREVLEAGAAEFVERAEARLAAILPHAPARLRAGMRLVNAAAWDTALRPDTLERVQRARGPARALARELRAFLDFAVAGLLDGHAREGAAGRGRGGSR